MYFSVNTLTQAITAHKYLGSAAKYALNELGTPAPFQLDPVKVFNETTGNNPFVLQNVSDAFESISESDDIAAQELAASYKQAIDDFYLTKQ